ncbi:MAG: hypothetical protein FWF45_00640 [Coriobacteriia bacterium]|nr:hypothetical protein [Coriobacteriia bacterium]
MSFITQGITDFLSNLITPLIAWYIKTAQTVLTDLVKNSILTQPLQQALGQNGNIWDLMIKINTYAVMPVAVVVLLIVFGVKATEWQQKSQLYDTSKPDMMQSELIIFFLTWFVLLILVFCWPYIIQFAWSIGQVIITGKMPNGHYLTYTNPFNHASYSTQTYQGILGIVGSSNDTLTIAGNFTGADPSTLTLGLIYAIIMAVAVIIGFCVVYVTSVVRFIKLYFCAAFGSIPMALYASETTRPQTKNFVTYFSSLILSFAIAILALCLLPALAWSGGLTVDVGSAIQNTTLILPVLKMLSIFVADIAVIAGAGSLAKNILGG